VAKDSKLQAEHAKKSADAGNLHGFVEWGLCLLDGIGTARDETTDIRFIRRSAEAKCLWDCLLIHGLGVTKDEAGRCALVQGRGGSGLFCRTVQVRLLPGLRDGSAEGRGEATRYYKLAAEQGFACAQMSYGVCLACGAGVRKDEDGNFRWR
jgi:TPR repeat protein